MALLLYCVTGPDASLTSLNGVAGTPVSRLEQDGFSIFYSENASTDVWVRAPLRTAAAEFHRVQRELFRSGSILPFRFPTILQNENELREHLGVHSSEYKSLLRRFASCVQMDIALTYSGPSTSSSGAGYLRERQARTRTLDQFAETMRAQVASLLKDWRQRSASNGLRCFALLERKQVEEFNERIKRIAVPQEVSARASGPWPVAEFLA